MVVDIPKTLKSALIEDGFIFAYEPNPKWDFVQTIYTPDLILDENPTYVVKTDAHGKEIEHVRKYDNFVKAITDVMND